MDSGDIDVKVEIQKTLISLNEITLKIKNELNIINDLVKKDGQLHTAVVDANKTLTVVAQDMGINVKNILSNEKSENESQFNLRDIISSAAFQEKILACLNNM
ncbi:uncharacterized protein LOC117237415 [Bombus vosnesenskii]|uniref:Uncharacterized protein LOC117237415 n=1 Tax=Bombus vosnesenskii TaxID=207650 RepID=A0A6J3KVW3_9HYME|nr:uncharacterized protein LOC117237415 [Bombus vosnesenskii]